MYVSLRICLRLRFRRQSVILNQIVENKSFENCVFKKLLFKNIEHYFFKSHAIVYFFENT